MFHIRQKLQDSSFSHDTHICRRTQASHVFPYYEIVFCWLTLSVSPQVSRCTGCYQQLPGSHVAYLNHFSIYWIWRHGSTYLLWQRSLFANRHYGQYISCPSSFCLRFTLPEAVSLFCSKVNRLELMLSFVSERGKKSACVTWAILSELAYICACVF